VRAAPLPSGAQLIGRHRGDLLTVEVYQAPRGSNAAPQARGPKPQRAVRTGGTPGRSTVGHGRDLSGTSGGVPGASR
jgi:hypothetical protein